MNKKTIYYFTKYTVKNPILFIFAIIIFIVLIGILTVSTKVVSYRQHDGVLSGNKICIYGMDSNTQIVNDNVYLYNDRNDAVIKTSVEGIVIENDVTSIYIEETSELDQLDKQNLKIDIPIDKISLFERIFFNGGKSYQ